MKRFLKIIAALAVLATCCACADKAAKTDNCLKKVFKADEPGAAVLVVRSGDVLFQGCYGLADMETKAKVTPQTAFNIASVSKQFTATAVMTLVEKGKLRLTDPVGDYFPEYTDPLWKKVQIRHLLSHTSGIPDKRNYPREVKIKGDDDLAMEYFQTLDTLLFEPGTDYRYTNPTYVLLGRLIERVSGQPFEEYMAGNIFGPAGMNRTCYFGPEKEIPEMAHAYKANAEAPQGWAELDYGEETFFATRPDGGIYTGIEDLSKWIPALLEEKIVSSESRKALWTPALGINDGEGYCYGFAIRKSGGRDIIYHCGGNGAFRSVEAYYPESNTLILILAARSDWNRDGIWKMLEDTFCPASVTLQEDIPVYLWAGGTKNMNDSTLRANFELWKSHGVRGVCVNLGWDIERVKEVSTVAHEYGMEYHACVSAVIDPTKDSSWYTVNRLGQSAYDKPAYVPYYKTLDPHNPEVADYLVTKFTELARIPTVDFVQLDYIRYADVILARGLWNKYGLVMDEEYAPADYCYCNDCVADFKEKTGIDIRKVEDPSKCKEWSEFRCDIVTSLVNRIAAVVHAEGKKVSADVFPGPDSHAVWMVRQQWNEWDVDTFFPMNYNDFYLEPASWLEEITAEEVKSIKGKKSDLYSGLFICRDWRNKDQIEDPEGHGLLPSELEEAVIGAMKAGATGICLFSSRSVTPEHWAELDRITGND